MPQPDATISESAITQLLRGWVKAMAEYDDGHVIIAHPGAPRPTVPYALLNLISGSRARENEMGGIVYEEVTVNGEPRILERRAEDWEWTYSVNLYASDAFDKARVLTNSLRTGTVLVDHLDPLQVRDVSMTRRVPEMVENTWEGRAQFDITVAGMVMDGFLIDVVETGSLTFALRIGATDEGLDVTKAYAKPA